MVQKKVDPRVRGLIEHGVRKNHRSFFVLVGDHGKDQVENIHKILSKMRVKARPSVLWCYKKELGFSTHRKKRIKEIKKNQARGLHDPDRDDPFDLFISSTTIRWTYYKETENILGQTFGMCVLQDFEAITPNILARTIETVEGGGVVIILMKTVKSLKQLYAMSMDVHSRFRTEAHNSVVPRFNERFILSLGDCNSCLVLDDELNILPISTSMKYLPVSEGLEEGDADASGYFEEPQLVELKASLADTPNAGNLVALSKTFDQGKAILSFLDAISEKTLRSTVVLTAARGRGKSAAIGLCLAGAISYGYSNVFVTAPSPENLKTVFEFIINGLKALKYNEHMDFEVVYENINDVGKVVIRINIFKEHRQTIQYIKPTECEKLSHAELVAIDEAAAIPLPTIKKLMGPYLTFLSSTVNGYEGTGRSLSLKLIQQLRVQQGAALAAAAKASGDEISGPKSKKGERRVHEDRWKAAAESAARGITSNARILTELKLDTPIRYSLNDPIEKWLNNLLCLDVTTHSTRIVSSMPAPKDCELFMVNRDALFSYHSLSETFLQRIWALYTSAHYKNTPNDLQMLSDAPAHRLFVLLGPNAMAKAASGSSAIPDILCVVQIAFEGCISKNSIQTEMTRGTKASGDLIPWNVCQQFNDNEFATLSGARIVRIATHPDVQKMGYGSRAIDILMQYFHGEISFHSDVGTFGGEGGANDASTKSKSKVNDNADLAQEDIKPRAELPPLLTALVDRPAERLNWIGVSFGLTSSLQNFWSRKGFKLCYLRQTSNELTGEHSAIVLREVNYSDAIDAPTPGWLNAYVSDYRKRLVSLLSYSFSKLETPLAVSIIDPDRELTSEDKGNNAAPKSNNPLDHYAYSGIPVTAKEMLTVHFSHHDIKRLELYSRNMVDHHMIYDLLPSLARLAFLGRVPNLRLSSLQVVILLATGLQHRDVDSIAAEIDLPVSQVLAFFNKTIRKITTILRELIETDTALELPNDATISRIEKRVGAMDSMEQSLKADHDDDVKEYNKIQKELIMSNKTISMHAIDADSSLLENEFKKSYKKQNAIPSSISITSTTKDKSNESNDDNQKKKDKKRKHDKHDGDEKKKKKHKKDKESS